jgi:hypothetical protein
MAEQAKALAAEQGLAWVKPTLDPMPATTSSKVWSASAEPAPLTEAELARLDALDASYDEHAAILEDEDSAEEALPLPRPRSRRSSANARTSGPGPRCWRPNSRQKRA